MCMALEPMPPIPQSRRTSNLLTPDKRMDVKQARARAAEKHERRRPTICGLIFARP
jgi:hypothetical protein